jgi:hypothetical protein
VGRPVRSQGQRRVIRRTLESRPMAIPAPTLRDDRLTLEQLGSLAREFDQFSAEDGRTWPDTAFVEWLADEWRASAEVNVTGAERREAA